LKPDRIHRKMPVTGWKSVLLIEQRKTSQVLNTRLLGCNSNL
jgi:hypothetical protein